MEIKSLNYSSYADRLFAATDGVGTDESEIYQIAQDMRAEIALGVVQDKLHGSEAVNRQNALMREAMKYLGESYAVVAKAKGDESLVRSNGADTIKNIFADELSDTEINSANQMYGITEYANDYDFGWTPAGIITSLIGTTVLLALIPPVGYAIAWSIFIGGGVLPGVSLSVVDLEARQDLRDCDPTRIQIKAEYGIT